MALSDESIESIREEISQAVLDFVSNVKNNDKILLLRSPQGTGKTITTLKTLLSNKKILTIFLSYGHNHLDDILDNDVLKQIKLVHIKGREQPDANGNNLCVNPLYDKLVQYKIDISRFLCNYKRCSNLLVCKYLKQYEDLKYEVQSWGGVHSHLNTDFPSDYLKRGGKRFDYKCLVIDENPISSLSVKTEFTEDHLEKLIETLIYAMEKAKLKKNVDKNKCEQWFLNVISIIESLKKIIKKTDKKGIRGLRFIKEFVSGSKQYKADIEELKNVLADEDSEKYIESYKDVLYEIFTKKQEKRYVIDFFEDVLSIVEKCIFYYENNVGNDINLPFYSEQSDVSYKGIIHTGKYIVSIKVNKKLPKIPVIIIDATGDKELYRQIFGREIIEYNPSVKIKRNIVQFTDGMYYSQSLYKDTTRERVYNAVLKIIESHHKKKDGIVNIVAMKKYARIEDEDKDYKNKSIERYLKEHKSNMANIRIWHYGDVKGKNEMQTDKVLILVGTPEPNIYAFPKEIECWYEGENKIDTTRIHEPKGSKYHDYRYSDPRYFAHIRSIREHEIEQDIERLRFALSSKGKVVYVFSMLPLSYETNKTTIDNYFSNKGSTKIIARYHVLKTLNEGRGKVSHQTLSDKTRYKKAVKEAGGISKVIDDLLKIEVIKQVGLRKKRVYSFTKKGKEYYYNNLKRLWGN